jgi:predicted N-acyltransferase
VPRCAAAERLTVSTVGSLAELDPSDWDACAAGSVSGGTNPFVSSGFLRSLEESGSLGASVGWLPRHIVVKNDSGRLVGCAPAYLKAHSQGEYVFDHQWASAYARYGADYYPKLLCAVPFTPVTGPRLLVRADAPAETLRALAGGLVGEADALQLSSAHVNFLCREQAASLASTGEWLIRTGMQYHWLNRGYQDWAAFEMALIQKRRKTIRQERKRAREGLRIRRLRGAELTPAVWDAFYAFYVDTTDRKWGQAYLTRAFFDLLSEYISESVMLITAEEDEPGGGAIVAAALNLIGSEAVFGRNWGCRPGSFYPLLHYELCFYQAIEEGAVLSRSLRRVCSLCADSRLPAIVSKLQRVEAGAQGEHKVPRGYLPTSTLSAHYIRTEPFRNAIGDFLRREGEEMELLAAAMLENESPFKAAVTQFERLE